MISSRRGFLTGLVASAFAAPAIVRAASLMPVKAMPPVETLEDLLRARMQDAYRITREQMSRLLFSEVFYRTEGVPPYAGYQQFEYVPLDCVLKVGDRVVIR
jgi:hypothetical protein